jgi:hypothetical protein
MRLNIDRWSSSSTALELIPCGRVRSTAAYFRAGRITRFGAARCGYRPGQVGGHGKLLRACLPYWAGRVA